MPTYLYAIGRVQGPIKIGISDNPEGRLAQFQTSCPFRIAVLHAEVCESRAAAIADEAFAHLFLKDRRAWGEWFNIQYAVAHDVVSASVMCGNEFRRRESVGE